MTQSKVQGKAQGKTAIVFGGSRGIGAAIAQQLAADGANVVITYVSAADKAATVLAAIEKQGVAGLAIKADSSNAVELRDAVAQAAARFGRLDIVVVNAGIYHNEDVTTFDIDALDRMLAVNVRGVFLAIQASLAHMQRGGRIITMGSIAATFTRYPGASVYSMTKAAVAVMAKGIAVDLAPRGITINNVQPGPIETDMTAEIVDAIKDAVPLQRVGQADEIAGFVSYLASDAPSYMTGASLTVDGGMSL